LRDAPLSTDELTRWAARFERGLLTWCVGADRTIVVHIDASGVATSCLLARGRAELQEAVRRLREAAIQGRDEERASLAHELARVILPDALRAAVVGAQADERLLFLLHGPLERVPLALLQIDGIALDELCTPLALPGIPSGAPEEEAGRGREWFLLGAPAAPEESPAPRGASADFLPGAKQELEELARLHPNARVAAGDGFHSRALEQALLSGDPVHIATHLVSTPTCEGGVLAPVALVLSAGELYCAERVRSLAPRSPLVVLSTCESAGGRFVDAEGLFGLSRTFLRGSRNLLVTLWPVEDGIAARAALLFHEAWAAGRSPSRAARDMRRGLRAEGYPSSEWGAYRLSGRD
jgi:CHAT domain-containing protein